MYYDHKTQKIPNLITLPAALLGLLLNTYFTALDGFILALQGWLVPVALLFVLFALRMLGAGDIKLFAAVGALMGYCFALGAIVFYLFRGGNWIGGVNQKRNFARKNEAFV